MVLIGGILAFVGGILLLIGAIMILVAAFKENTTQGLLCLFVPFYAIYYLFAKYSNPNKTAAIILYLGGLVILIVGYILIMSGAASMVNELMQYTY